MTLPLRRMQVKVKLNIIFLNDMKRINKYLFIILVEREIKLEKKKRDRFTKNTQNARKTTKVESLKYL